MLFLTNHLLNPKILSYDHSNRLQKTNLQGLLLDNVPNLYDLRLLALVSKAYVRLDELLFGCFGSLLYLVWLCLIMGLLFVVIIVEDLMELICCFFVLLLLLDFVIGVIKIQFVIIGILKNV